MKTPASTAVLALALAAFSLAAPRAAESNAPLTTTSEVSVAPTNTVQEVRIAPQDLEEFRREMAQAADRNAQMLKSAIEPLLARQHQNELDILENANRTIFIGAGIFAAMGLVGFLLVAWMLVRAMGRFSEMAAQQGETVRALGLGRIPAALGPGQGAAAAISPEQTSTRFMGAIERLEKRIHELELTTPGSVIDAEAHGPAAEPRTRSNAQAHPGHAPHASGSNGGPIEHPEAEGLETTRVEMLLRKGQTLLSLSRLESALACFDEVLKLEPDHTEAVVKKGLALERLQHFDEAIACYNQAIQLDESLTVAWLHKGGLCNRLERHEEALECYEQAIRHEQKAEP